MSFVSCYNSAILDDVLPIVPVPNGRVGSQLVTPMLAPTATASTVFVNAIAPLILPKGIWLISGDLSYASAGGNIQTSLTARCRYQRGAVVTTIGSAAVVPVTSTSSGMVLSFVVDSEGPDGINALSSQLILDSTCTLSAGTFTIDDAGSVVRIFRLA